MKKLLLVAILSVAANSFAEGVKHVEPLEGEALRTHNERQEHYKNLRAQGVKTHKIDGIHKRYTKVTNPAK